MTISKAEARRKAKENWFMWRLMLSDMNISYSDLDKMDNDDLAEANAALDLYMEYQKKEMNKK
ncbi:hypothetical protein [Paenibacillus sp. IHBB 10380]|uniref:hypothetical protein n=1 Tax=Paenibacillus sp. IHBB 10380 TaxID=1566358 RepID=UPI0011862DA7|nr:hypothetical protein [Paenibacillus sp. IHBB 10380]